MSSSSLPETRSTVAPLTAEAPAPSAPEHRGDSELSGLRVFAAVLSGHFAIDVFNSMGPVLLAYLRGPLSLSPAQIGFAVGLQQFFAGTTQPLFGWLTDRRGSRWLGPVSVALTVGCVSSAVWLADRTGSFLAFLLLLALGAVGSGAFHPQGTMHAGAAVSGRAATTTALFFFCGQAGLASGPVLAGLLLDQVGVVGIPALALLLAPVPLYMAVAMAPAAPRRRLAPTDREPILLGPLEPVIALFALVFGLRAWIFIGTAAFLPLLFQGHGWSSTAQGVATGLFWLGGGIGGVVAGWLADRLGRRRLVFVTTLGGALLLVLVPRFDGVAAFALTTSCGLLLGAPHSVLMVMAQALLPVRRALASGLALGFLFAMGAVGAWGIGILAERFTLGVVLQGGALLGAVAAGLCLLLPPTR